MPAIPSSPDRPCWFVGALWSRGDQMERFLAEGVWENGYEDRFLDQVRAMQVGDRIAIKASYTRKRGLPFDNRGQTVSVMSVKAVGTVTSNPGDGRRVQVDWQKVDPPREWYFYTGRTTVWRVLPGEWMNDNLVAFAFEGGKQDLDRFRNEPYWRERYGEDDPAKHRFRWTRFYEAVAEKLLPFRQDRKALLAFVQDLAGRYDLLSYLHDGHADGTTGPLPDICPFTFMGIFNRGIRESSRKALAGELAKFLGVEEPVPPSFEGVPVLNNQRSCFFSFEREREPDDMDLLWEVFAAADRFAKSDELEDRAAFAKAYDRAIRIRGVAWNLSVGLFWAHPWVFPTLDGPSREYIVAKLSRRIEKAGSGLACGADQYLALMDALDAAFKDRDYPVHSYPELSLEAWRYKAPDDEAPGETGPAEARGDEGGGNGDELDVEVRAAIAGSAPYSVKDILDDGCFLEAEALERILATWRSKLNVILQGPPGTGKTWLARRLAFALMGQKDERRIRMVQFHTSLSYEDFVRGFRPTGTGGLDLTDGVFLQAIKAAMDEPKVAHVVVIEEINRGNPAQIFGEMLTLLESDKRTPSCAMELCYRRNDQERISIPKNLFVIGTMNTADRSLALVDFALRRRFAFIRLDPALGQTWRDWVVGRNGLDPAMADLVKDRVGALNDAIASDGTLGKPFRIGHSFFTPPDGTRIDDARTWFRQIVDHEIEPLLTEYWPDGNGKAETELKRLLEGF